MLPDAKQDDVYARLMALPENSVGEIIDGRLHVPCADPSAARIRVRLPGD
jgi:hypothetical protein